MMPFLKLVHYELFRVRKMYLVMLGLTLVVQFAGIFVYAHSYMNRVQSAMKLQGITQLEYAVKYQPASFYQYSLNSIWFMAPIAMGAAIVAIYVFVIWYRDWYAKSIFIYRLMMLPVSRMAVYLAKLTTIMLLTLGLVAFELLILPFQNALFEARLPEVLRIPLTLTEIVANHPLLKILAPAQFIDFILHYSMGLTAVTILFTAIMMERSYRLRGVIAGIIYGSLALAIFLAPVFFSEMRPYLLYPKELLALELVMVLIILSGSGALSSYLIKNKVTL
ncbi:MAG: hypothetical protein K0R57_4891 [Paenibacillaceae bacterium]|jgi:hypothetical protein|nr:hypothetical protein [Paenibacillaceae bacterium]